MTADHPNVTGGRVRIAISSPEIMAHIRQEFTSRGLAVQIDGLPSVDLLVSRAPEGAAPAAGVLVDILSRLAGRGSRPRTPALARYRLALVPRGRQQRPPESSPQSGSGAAVTPTDFVAPPTCDSVPPDVDTARGQVPLSKREAEVMALISRGMRNSDIASHLDLREKTVKNHVNRIFSKLGARNRVDAVLTWQSTGRYAPRGGEAPGPASDRAAQGG